MKETKQQPETQEEVSKTEAPVSTETTKKYKEEELLVIFDTILFEGSYTEDVTIKGKLKVTFRSRTADETSKITSEIDSKQYNFIPALQEQRAFLNLVYSLVTYNGRNLEQLSLDDKKSFVGKLPAVVVAALSNALFDFDNKIEQACQEGEENF